MPFWWDIDCLAPSRLLHAPVAVLPVLTPVLVTKSLYNRTLSFLLLDLFSQQPSSRSNAMCHDSWEYPSPVPPLYLRFASSRPAGCWELDDRMEKPLHKTQISLFYFSFVHNLNQTGPQLVRIVSSFQHYNWIFSLFKLIVIWLLLISIIS